MEPSSAVADAILRFYSAFGTGSTEAFDRVVSVDPSAMVIGTDRRLDDRDTWRAGFATLTNMTLEPGDVRALRDGTVGWIVDDPTFVAPDGRRLHLRLTAVAREEGDTWKLVQVHLSVMVPDDVALAQAAQWEASAPA